MGFKRPRGRPRIENPANRKGSIRGARQGTIELFRKVCKENNKDPGDELERLLRQAIEELAGPQALKQILKEMEDEHLMQAERIQRLREKIATLAEEQGRGPPDGIPYEEALERNAQRIGSLENRSDYLSLLEPSARKMAADYHRHWQSIKQDLRHRVEEILEGETKRAKGE
jgi:hypothetical protein